MDKDLPCGGEGIIGTRISQITRILNLASKMGDEVSHGWHRFLLSAILVLSVFNTISAKLPKSEIYVNSFIGREEDNAISGAT